MLFVDFNSRIIEYEMCVGIVLEKCDVSDFVSFGMVFKGIIIGLSLNYFGWYFVIVRVMNEVGYSSLVVFNGI